MRNIRRFAALIAILFSALLCQCAEKQRVLPELIGTWVSNDERYEGRYFTVYPRTIVIGLGDGQTRGYAIKKVESEIHRGRVLYTIVYMSEDWEEYRMPLYYAHKDRALIAKNQPGLVWHRRGVRR